MVPNANTRAGKPSIALDGSHNCISKLSMSLNIGLDGGAEGFDSQRGATKINSYALANRGLIGVVKSLGVTSAIRRQSRQPIMAQQILAICEIIAPRLQNESGKQTSCPRQLRPHRSMWRSVLWQSASVSSSEAANHIYVTYLGPTHRKQSYQSSRGELRPARFAAQHGSRTP